MNTEVQNIYVRQRPLLWSLARYAFALVFWIVLVCFSFHPENFKIHPDLSPFIYIPLLTAFVVIIFANFCYALRKTCRSIIELTQTPKLVYSLSNIGLTDYRADKSFEWNEFVDIRISPIDGDARIVLNTKTKPLIIEKRGLTSEDYNNILNFISSRNQSA